MISASRSNAASGLCHQRLARGTLLAQRPVNVACMARFCWHFTAYVDGNEYIWWSDVTESMATIRSPFYGYKQLQQRCSSHKHANTGQIALPEPLNWWVNFLNQYFVNFCHYCSRFGSHGLCEMHKTYDNKKLSYRRVTARCVLSVVILPITTQQCINYLYDKSWPNRWYKVGGLVGGNVV